MSPKDLSFALTLIWLPSQSWDGNQLASKVRAMIKNKVSTGVKKSIIISRPQRSPIKNRHHIIQIQAYFK